MSRERPSFLPSPLPHIQYLLSPFSTRDPSRLLLSPHLTCNPIGRVSDVLPRCFSPLVRLPFPSLPLSPPSSLPPCRLPLARERRLTFFPLVFLVAAGCVWPGRSGDEKVKMICESRMLIFLSPLAFGTGEKSFNSEASFWGASEGK